MALNKVIITTSFEFESIDSQEATIKAKQLVSDILDQNPRGENYQNYNISVEVLPLKDKYKVEKLKVFNPNQVFTWLDNGEISKTFKVGNNLFDVKLTSSRLFLFKNNPSCVACGLTGNKFVLECHADNTAHLNFYAEEDGKDVLMTKDHIKARAYGGSDCLENLETCCMICNQVKSSFPISYESVRKLRDMLRNPNHLSSRELRRQISEVRLLMVDCLNGQ